MTNKTDRQPAPVTPPAETPADTTDADAIQAILDQLAAKRAAEAHGALFAALGAAQHELELTKHKLGTVTGQLADARAELAAARRELDRIARASLPPDPATLEPERVTCARCHAVIAIVGRDPILPSCHICGLPVAK